LSSTPARCHRKTEGEGKKSALNRSDVARSVLLEGPPNSSSLAIRTLGDPQKEKVVNEDCQGKKIKRRMGDKRL